MTQAMPDSNKKSLNLKTKYKELTMYSATEEEHAKMVELVTKHSRGSNFSDVYGIIKYISSQKLGRIYLCENREDFSNNMALFVPFKKLMDSPSMSRAIYYNIVEKFSAEICKSFEFEKWDTLITVEKVFFSDSTMVLLYNLDQFSIPLDSLMASEDIKTDEVIALISNFASVLSFIRSQTDVCMQEIHPKNIYLVRDLTNQDIILKVFLSFLPSASKEYMEFIDNKLYFNPMLIQPQDRSVSDLPFLLSYTYSLYALIFKLLGNEEVFSDSADFEFEEDDVKNVKNIAAKISSKLTSFSAKSRKYSIIAGTFKDLLLAFTTAGDESLDEFHQMLIALNDSNKQDNSFDNFMKDDPNSENEK